MALARANKEKGDREGRYIEISSEKGEFSYT
jgi:hypothetical protein